MPVADKESPEVSAFLTGPSPTALLTEDESQRNRRHKLQQFDAKFSKILSYAANGEYTALLQKMNNMQMEYSLTLQQMKFKLERSERKHEFQMRQMHLQYDSLKEQCMSIEDELSGAKTELTLLGRKLHQKQGQIEKYRKMIKNQEQLIDDFKSGMEEQICLEKEMLKVGFAQRQLTLKNELNRALQAMENNYEEKFKQAANTHKLKGHQKVIHTFQKHFQLCRGDTKIHSQYSTQAHDRPNKDTNKIS